MPQTPADITEERETDLLKLRENLATIRKINKWLKAVVILMLVAILSALLSELDLFAYVAAFGVVGVAFANYCCARATGYTLAEISGENNGCALVLYTPIFLILSTSYVVGGWIYGLVAKAKLTRENEQIIAKHGEDVCKPIMDP